MLRVFSEGDDLYRLENEDGAHVGTIRGRAISFWGFSTENDARAAAIAAWGAMTEALRREYPSWPRYELALDRLGTVHDGAYEWYYDGTRAIARLVRPGRGDREPSFGIELLLPSYASEGVAITASHGMARAVAAHRDDLRRDAPDGDARARARPANGAVEIERAGFPVRYEEVTSCVIDESSADSFPASDPPAWSSLRVGAPIA